VTAATAGKPLRPVIDELGYDLVDMPGVSVEETVFEPLDHN
jgi:predicted ATPase